MSEINKRKIQQRLKKLDDAWLSAAFAVRIAFDSLPRLVGDNKKQGEPPFLWFWKEEKRAKQLLAVFRALQCAWSAVNLRNKEIAYATAHFFVANNATAARAVDAAADAARAAAASDSASAIRAAVIAIPIAPKGAVEHILSLEKNHITGRFLNFSVGINFQPNQIHLINELQAFGHDFDYWADWYEARLRGEPLDEQLARESCLLPNEILAKSPAEINAYLKSLRDKHATELLNQVRAIFIGFGAVGKTSVIRVLNGEKVIEGEEDMTAGVEISKWSVPESDIKANLWDFGGQVMAHATHQFFLRSRCLYVLVLDESQHERNQRSNEGDAQEQAEYWLEHVRAFGGDAPVLLVGNKADQVRVNLDMRYLRDKYPNIVDFYPLSCTHCEEPAYKAEFQRFQRDFIAQLQAVGTHQILFTKPHFTVLEGIQERSVAQTFLPKHEFTSLCQEQNIHEKDGLDQAWLLDLLDKLGIIIHFPNLPWLDSYLLNPRWLTYGVYTLLYAEQTRQQQGRLDANTVINILQAKTLQDNVGHELHYAAEHCRFILDALEQFEIGFRLNNKAQSLLIPALLPSDTPKHGFNKQDALAFDFDFSGFLPRHVLPGFIVRRHEEIADNTVWQNGVRLHSPNLDAEALVQADYHERRVSLWINGSQAGWYFRVLYDDILHMLSRMEDLPFEEFVHLPASARRQAPRRPVPRNLQARADFQDLLEKEAAGERQFTCKFGTYDLAEVLKIMPPEVREKTDGNTYNFPNATIKHSTLNLESELKNVTQTINQDKPN